MLTVALPYRMTASVRVADVAILLRDGQVNGTRCECRGDGFAVIRLGRFGQ